MRTSHQWTDGQARPYTHNPWSIQFSEEEGEIVEQLEAELTPAQLNLVMALVFDVKWNPRPGEGPFLATG